MERAYPLVLVSVLCTFAFACYRLSNRRALPLLPPGPKPLPLIGNLLALPRGHDGIFWAKHAALYGPMSSIKVFSNTIVILNDMQLAVDLLEKKSVIYSDRVVTEFVAKLCGAGGSVVFQQYGSRFRTMRKMFHQFMGTRLLVSRYESLEELEAWRLLLRIKRNPASFRNHFRRFAGTIILKTAYGYTVNPEGEDPLISLAERNLERFSQSSQPGAWLVDIFPAIKLLPDWFPGMGYRNTASQWKLAFAEARLKPYEFAKSLMASGNYFPSFVTDNCQDGICDAEYEQLLINSAQDLYGGGSDTTVSVLATFTLAMVLYPDIIRRAREELDRVVGTDRLPSFSDRSSLPYVESVLKECLRWEVVTPAGVPHVASQDDVHNGYFIPKGAVIVPNIWKFTHDENIYHDPFTFKPERHMSSEDRKAELDPRNLIFGFGRRTCPGKEFADSSLFITIAMCLAVFDFDKARDSEGRVIEPEAEYCAGTISHPSDFQCSIAPRSEKAAALIESFLDEHPFEPGYADKLKDIICY